MRGAGRNEALAIWHDAALMTKAAAKLEHPSSVSALRADPPPCRIPAASQRPGVRWPFIVPPAR
ncbi:hypothetical protein MPLB_1360005 [Mesorhizobium sp. ORS 3324]|nr:hypothetical protein MPLB_1360005 [Mesorhizobium sp. ORS 3324]